MHSMQLPGLKCFPRCYEPRSIYAFAVPVITDRIRLSREVKMLNVSASVARMDYGRKPGARHCSWLAYSANILPKPNVMSIIYV